LPSSPLCLRRHHPARRAVDEDVGLRPIDHQALALARADRVNDGARVHDGLAGVGKNALDDRGDRIAAVVVRGTPSETMMSRLLRGASAKATEATVIPIRQPRTLGIEV